MRLSRRLRCVLALLVFTAGAALAQTYPAGPMRVIVPFPPGGGTDILARAIAHKLNEAWGQPVIVDNRGGANGTIGAAAAAKAPADGHTIIVVPSGFAVNPSIYKNLPFDALKDFAPVTQLAASPLVLVVHPSFPSKSVKELIAFLKARPEEINYGSSGNGSPPHLATELFKLLTGTKMTHIPYKGAGPAAVDVIAGQIPIYFMNALQAVPHMKSGRLRALGVTSDKRFPGLPHVPTIAEAGVPGYAMTNWYGMLVPANTPQNAIARLHAEVARILNLPDLKDRLSSEGAEVIASTPGEFAAFLRQEMAKAAKIVKASGMTATN
ncbi:MAG: Bug family tripartite tricarboxylate transporter substrate binding protein [Burkholderiales bacterium]